MKLFEALDFYGVVLNNTKETVTINKRKFGCVKNLSKESIRSNKKSGLFPIHHKDAARYIGKKYATKTENRKIIIEIPVRQ